MEKYEWRKIDKIVANNNSSNINLSTDQPVKTDPHNYSPFTQTQFYANWQSGFGRKVDIFEAYSKVDSKNITVASVVLITYLLIAKKSYIYAPYGPVLLDIKLLNDADFLQSLKKLLSEVCKSKNAVFARLDFSYPEIFTEKDSGKQCAGQIYESLKKFFRPAPSITYHSAYFQPRYEWFLKIEKSEEEILKEMHEKTRYSVRLSARKEIEVKIVTNNDEIKPIKYFEDFYSLMEETAKRNGFSLHTKKYYEEIFKSLGTDKELEKSYLAIAYYKGKILAMDLVIVHGKIANYVFGASNNEERNRMPAHGAQWASIKHAKSLGCELYNFGGVSLEGEGHSYKGWEGLTSFKQKFGGYAVYHLDFFDFVALPFWYHLYNLRKYVKKFLPFI